MSEVHDRLSRLFVSAPDVGNLFDDERDCHATSAKITLDSYSAYPAIVLVVVLLAVVLLAVIGVLLS